jgi:hypothetical protein
LAANANTAAKMFKFGFFKLIEENEFYDFADITYT